MSLAATGSTFTARPLLRGERTKSEQPSAILIAKGADVRNLCTTAIGRQGMLHLLSAASGAERQNVPRSDGQEAASRLLEASTQPCCTSSGRRIVCDMQHYLKARRGG